MPTRYHVYRLIDPRPGRGDGFPEGQDIYYVGETTSLNARHKQHAERKKATTPAEKRNQDILAAGCEPVMECLETFDTALEALVHELYYIIHYGKQGYEILNREAVGYVYEQARKLMSDARIHSHHSPTKASQPTPKHQHQRRPSATASSPLVTPVHELLTLGMSSEDAEAWMTAGWEGVETAYRPLEPSDFDAYVLEKVRLAREQYEAGALDDPAAWVAWAIKENWPH